MWATFFTIDTLCKVRNEKLKKYVSSDAVSLGNVYISLEKNASVEIFCVTGLIPQYRINKKENAFTRIFC